MTNAVTNRHIEIIISIRFLILSSGYIMHLFRFFLLIAQSEAKFSERSKFSFSSSKWMSNCFIMFSSYKTRYDELIITYSLFIDLLFNTKALKIYHGRILILILLQLNQIFSIWWNKLKFEILVTFLLFFFWEFEWNIIVFLEF